MDSNKKWELGGNAAGEQRLAVRCGEAGDDGGRLASAMSDGQTFSERIRLEDAYERVRFAARALRHLGLGVTRERLAELDLQLLRVPLATEMPMSKADERPLERFSERKSAQVSWLWPGRIARGAITLLAGDPGLGKSLLTLDIAARVSRGSDWPDGARGPERPGSVVLLSGEDNLETTILPRLEAMDADMSQFVTVEPQRDDWHVAEPPSFELDRDMDELRRTVGRLGDCGLVVLDPISAFLGRTGESSNAVVRRLLAPLEKMARQERVAVVIVAHLRKDMGAAVRQALGSMAFMAVSRAAWLVSRDVERPERRLVLAVKNNLAKDADGLAYEVVASSPETLSGKPAGGAVEGDCIEGSGVALVKWSAERIRMRADEAFCGSRRPAQRPDTERREAKDWLRECLSTGPRGALEVRELAEAHGFAFSTLKRAFRELQGVARKDQSTRHGAWMWALPGVGGQVEERSGGVAEEAGRQVEEWSRGVVEEVGLQVESETELDGVAGDVDGGDVEDIDSSSELKPLFPITAEMAEAEAQVLAMMRRSDEEVAEMMARLRAEERERLKHAEVRTNS